MKEIDPNYRYWDAWSRIYNTAEVLFSENKITEFTFKNIEDDLIMLKTLVSDYIEKNNNVKP